ncbi:hypothetical protein [Actinomadura hibisca]|uniref:hypothetical protein n=1 Tax=Actinomadura hibisca TaxID=68565 RepID=UPI000AB4FCE9|nr:hypothetical protein [Actinomadura hibisca]
MLEELSYMPRWRWVLAACLLVGAGVVSLAYGWWFVGLPLVLGAVAFPVQWLVDRYLTERRLVSFMVPHYGEMLDEHEFDPRTDDATEAMLRDYQEAHDIYERLKRLGKGDYDRVNAELDRGYDAIDRLDLQWIGSTAAGRSKREDGAGEPGEHALQISERPWDGEPLHVFAGRGKKVLALPEGFGRETVVEFRNLGTEEAVIRHRNRRLESFYWLFSCAGGTVGRALLVDNRKVPSHLKIETRGEWTLALLDFAAVPRFVESRTGQGEDVFLYAGGPALAEVTAHNGDHPAYSSLFVLSKLEAEQRDLLAFRSGVVPLAGPTVLRVAGESRWSVDVQPLDTIRSFDRKIEGSGNDVVRYTGPTAHARFRHGERLKVRLLDEGLREIREIFLRHDDGEVIVLLERGALLHMGTDATGWSISVDH